MAWGKGTPAHTTGLDGIPRPPGEGGVSYQNACVVREAGNQFQIYKFPLSPSHSDEDYSFASSTDSSTYVMSGAVGMAKNGVPIYSYMNNAGRSAWDSCEVDYCNAHSGRGEDYHYHGDPFGTKCAYDQSDYSGSHPP